MKSQQTALAYPQRSFGMTAKMEDIGEVSIWDSVILGRELFRAHNAFAADELLNLVRGLENLQIQGMNQLEHSLRVATLAWNEISLEATKSRKAQREMLAARQQWSVAALCMYVGAIVAPDNALAFSAELLKPYVTENIYQSLKNFENFQASPESLRAQPLSQSWFADTERFSRWHRDAFNTSVTPFPLEHFTPDLKDLFKVSLLFKRVPDTRIIPE